MKKVKQEVLLQVTGGSTSDDNTYWQCIDGLLVQGGGHPTPTPIPSPYTNQHCDGIPTTTIDD